MTVDQPQTPESADAASVSAFAPEPALTSFRAMPVDFNHVEKRLSHAFDNAKIPQNFASGFFAGAQRLGGSLEEVGNHVANLAVEIGKAESQKKIDEAELAMQKAHGDFAEWMAQNPDPKTWGPEWEKRVTALHDNITSQEGLSPYAKDQITRNYSKFAVQTGTGIQVAAAKQTFSDARDTGMAVMLQAADNGNWEAAHAKIDSLHAARMLTAVEAQTHHASIEAKQASASKQAFENNLKSASPDNPGGYDAALQIIKEGSQITPGATAPVFHPEVAEMLRQMVTTKRDTDQYFHAALMDPETVLKTLPQRTEDGTHYAVAPSMPETTRLEILGTARHQLANLQSNEGNDIRTGIDSNAIQTEEQLNKLFRYSNADQRAQLLNRLTSLHTTSTTANANALYDEVLHLPYEKGPNDRDLALKVGELTEKIKNTLSAGRAGPLLEALQDRMKNGTKENEHLLRLGSETLKQWDDGQMLGVRWKDKAERDKHFYDALTDPAKLAAYGLGDEAIQQITGKTKEGKDAGIPGLKGEAAAQAFRVAYGMALEKAKKDGKPSPQDNLAVSKLTDYTRGLFNSVIGHENETDQPSREQSAMNAERIRMDFEKWLKTQPTTPTVEKAMQQLHHLASPYTSETVDNVANPVPVNRQIGTRVPTNVEIQSLKAKYPLK